jgi:hypothetical protein
MKCRCGIDGMNLYCTKQGGSAVPPSLTCIHLLFKCVKETQTQDVFV